MMVWVVYVQTHHGRTIDPAVFAFKNGRELAKVEEFLEEHGFGYDEPYEVEIGMKNFEEMMDEFLVEDAKED